MKLIDLILDEHDGLIREAVVFLRHATSQVEILEQAEGNLHEFTAVQPIDGRYDFYPPHRSPPELIVVVVRDRVQAVYRLDGVMQKGPIGDLCSEKYRAFERLRRLPKTPDFQRVGLQYALSPLESGSLGSRVHGWEGRARATVQWHDQSFFDEVFVDATPRLRSTWSPSSIDLEWQEGTPKLKKHLSRERAPGLAAAKKADFLEKYGALFCQKCEEDPVKRYGKAEAASCIEVHHAATAVRDMKIGHRTKLSDLLLLCANCHRLEHALVCG